MVLGIGGRDEDVTVRIGADSDGAVNGIDAVIDSLGGLRTAAGLASGALAALATGGLAASIDAAAEFEEQLVDLQRVTDAATADQMADSLERIAASSPLAVSELAEVAETGGRLGIASENLTEFTRQTSQIAVATELTADQAATSFARLSNALDTPIERIEGMGSAINTLSQTTAAATDEIVSSMEKASPAAGTLGVAFDELAAIQATLVAAGQPVERSGTRMNRALTELSTNAAEVADAIGMDRDAFAELLEEDPTDALLTYISHLDDVETQQERVNEVTELFGSAGQQAILPLASNQDALAEALAASSEEFEDAESVAREYALASDTLSGRLGMLESRIGNAARETGEQFLPAVKDAVSVTADAVGGFNALNRASGGLVSSLGLVAVAAGGAVGALSLLGIGAATPVGLAIAGIGTLGVAWSQNWAEMRDITENSVSDIVQSTGRLFTTLGLIQEESEQTNDVWAEMADFWMPRVAQGVDMIATGFAQAVDTFASSIEMLVASIETSADVTGAILDPERGPEDIAAAARRGGERLRGLGQGMLERARERGDALQRRTERRRRGRPGFTSDAGGGGEDDPSFEDRIARLQEAYSEALQQNGLDDVRQNTGRSAEALERSALVQARDRCSLRDHLLSPFERAPPPRSTTSRTEAMFGGFQQRRQQLFDAAREMATGEQLFQALGGSATPTGVGGGGGGGEFQVTLNVDGRDLATETGAADDQFLQSREVVE